MHLNWFHLDFEFSFLVSRFWIHKLKYTSRADRYIYDQYFNEQTISNDRYSNGMYELMFPISISAIYFI